MRNAVDRSNRRWPGLVGLMLLALGAASITAESFRPVAAAGSLSLDQPVRVVLHRKSFADLPADAKELELEFTGENGTVSRLEATNEKQTFGFVRSEETALSCSRGTVKECDSLNLRGGGKLRACACVKDETARQTKEHILLARQVGVASMMTESTRAERIAPRSESGYDVVLSDKTPLRATSGRQTCWLNKRMRISVCY